MTYLLDANVLLRLITKEPFEQAQKALALLERAEAGELELILDAVILTQITYVLFSYYKYSRELIASEVSMLLNTEAFSVAERDLIERSLSRMAGAKIDFDDAYLIEKAIKSNWGVASFDRDFASAEVAWLEP